MPGQTTVTQPPFSTELQPSGTAQRAAAPKRSQYSQIVERLQAAHAPLSAWAVALKLFSYIRTNTKGRLTASVYAVRLASEMGISVPSVRRAIRCLTDGDAPVFFKRGASGQRRTIRWRKGKELTTRAVELEWIDDLPAFLAARDMARTVNVLAFEDRQKGQQPERLQLQAAKLKGELSPDGYERAASKLDTIARAGLPKSAQKSPRCLTGPQVRQFAQQLATTASYGERLEDGNPKAVRQFHALQGHVFGQGERAAGCATCETATALAVQLVPHVARFLAEKKLKAERCGCGARVLTDSPHYSGPVDFWPFVSGENSALSFHKACIHEQNRLLILRRE